MNDIPLAGLPRFRNLLSQAYTAVTTARQMLRADPALACVLAIVALGPLVFTIWYIEQYDTLKFGLIVLLTAAAYFYVCKEKVWRLSIQVRQQKTFLMCAGLFLGWAAIATLFAVDQVYAVFGFYNRLTSGLVFQVVVVALMALVAGFNRAQQKIIMAVAVSSAIVASLWSILQTIGFGYYDASVGLTWFRAPGLLGNPNFSSMYFIVLLPLAMWLAVASGSRPARIWFSMGSFMLLFAIILSGSRGALAASVCVAVSGLCLVGYYLPRSRKLLIVALCFIVLGIGLNAWFGAVTRPQIWQQTAALSDSNIQDRFAIWRVATTSIEHRPLLGTGLGNGLYAFEHERDGGLFTDAIYDDVHNFALQWAVVGGVPLMLFGLLLIGMATFRGFVKVRKQNSSQDVALLLALSAWVVTALFTPVSVPNYLILFVIIGLLVGGNDERSIVIPLRVSIFGRSIAAIVIVCALSFLAGELFSGLGVHAYKTANYMKSESLLKVGTHLNPTNPYALFFYAGSVIQNKRSIVEQDKVIQKNAVLHPVYNRTTIWLAHLYALQFYQQPTAEALHKIGDSLDRAILAEPYVRQHRYLRAQYYIMAQRNEEAKREMLSQVAQDPKYYYGWLLLAKIYQLQGNSEAFMSSLMQARDVSHDDLLYKLILTAKHEDIVTNVPLDIPNLLGAL